MEETHDNGVDRTILILSTAGNAQDVDAMLALYSGLNNESDQKKQIIEMLKSNPNIARSEMAQVLGIHESSVKRRLDSLVKEGYICRIGANKGGHWKVIKEIQ